MGHLRTTANTSLDQGCDGPYNCALKFCKLKEENVSLVGLKPNLALPCEESWGAAVCRVMWQEGWWLKVIWVAWILASLLALIGYFLLCLHALVPALWLITIGKGALIATNIAATRWVVWKRHDTGEELPEWYEDSAKTQLAFWTVALIGEVVLYCIETCAEHRKLGTERIQTILWRCTWKLTAGQHLETQRLLRIKSVRLRLWRALATCQDLMLRFSRTGTMHEGFLQDLLKTEGQLRIALQELDAAESNPRPQKPCNLS